MVLVESKYDVKEYREISVSFYTEIVVEIDWKEEYLENLQHFSITN